MDPKALNHLDPRAREAYDRIMGTAATHGTTDTTSPDPVAPSIDTTSPMPNTQPPAFNQPVTDPIATPANDNVPLSSSPFPDVQPVNDPVTPAPSIFDNPVTTPAPPAPSIFAPQNPVTPDPITDPSATLFVPKDADQTATHDTAPSAPASFFTNPTPAPSEPLTPPTPTATFPSLESDPTSEPTTPDPMAPVQPYAADDTQPTAFTQPLPSPAEVSQANAPHETSSLLRVLYIVGAVVFFAIYTIFWVKVFNLPFLF